MKRNLFLWLVLAALLFGMSDASAQKRAKKEKYNYEITIVLEGVPDTMLYIGYYYADKTYFRRSPLCAAPDRYGA